LHEKPPARHEEYVFEDKKICPQNGSGQGENHQCPVSRQSGGENKTTQIGKYRARIFKELRIRNYELKNPLCAP
jgi:hypothetical protein